MKDEKPDGYIAWHPSIGVSRALSQHMFCRSDLVLALCTELEFIDYDHCGCRFPLVSKLETSGWRVRPVKLVFLDEVKGE